MNPGLSDQYLPATAPGDHTKWKTVQETQEAAMHFFSTIAINLELINEIHFGYPFFFCKKRTIE